MLQRVLHFLPLVALSCFGSSPDSLLWNHVGYERTGPKTAVVKNASGSVADTGFQLLDATSTVVFQASASAQTQVPGWGNTDWKILDFSGFQDSGRYSLRLLPSGTVSDTFEIEDEALLRLAGPSVVSFFNSMESKDDGDHAIGYCGQPKRGTHDVYGGWMDATGDDGKYISHLSYANFMNPQQIPMVVWCLLRTSLLAPRAVAPWRSQLLSEAAWGADYLVRIQDTQGYFYINVFRSHWNMDTAKAICAWVGDSAVQGTETSDYQSAWREGGGMSIAALALASRTGVSGSFTGAQYLAAAELGFDHLSAVKGRWDDDGHENLIDHYCALLAAVELYQATQDPRYADSAAERADSIVARQEAPGWFLSDAGARPFYHAVDEGLPLVALWAYLEIDPSSPRSDAVRATLARSVQWYRSLTRGVANPFLYPRMYAPDAPPTGAASPGGDLALGATATSSSTQGGYPASNAVDGSANTRWGGALGDSTASLTIDLGQLVLVDSVALDWEAAYGKKYQLRVSADDANWNTVYSGGAAGAGWDGHAIPGVSARYVRMQGQELAQSGYGLSIYEFQVFGSVPSSPVVQVPSSARFFMPHDNETGYWWQGENARLGSLSAAFLLAGRDIMPSWSLSGSDSLSQEGVAGLDWVLGKNTAGENFMYGVAGGGTSPYDGGTNRVGGICNGITANSDADQSPTYYDNTGTSNPAYFYWHWTEQWLPHDANFLLGAASVAHLLETPPDLAVKSTYRPLRRMSIVSGDGRIRASLPSSADWTLADPSGRVMARTRGTSAEFAPGRGTWIVEAASVDGTRQSGLAVLP
ncbi:MAG TPA: discoidin domain-containing protein [Fibrobacteria bacterium]|nr:discoidin domain-containing protein [Fibrobacteria bacterium]